jgi:thiol-disulfide isomerase/thioredoxin
MARQIPDFVHSIGSGFIQAVAIATISVGAMEYRQANRAQVEKPPAKAEVQIVGVDSGSIAQPELLDSDSGPDTSTVPVAAEAKPKLLYFWFEGCGSCKKVEPEVAKLEKKKAFPLKRVNTLEEDGTLSQEAEKYKVTRAPTFIVVDGKGKPVARIEGYHTADQLKVFYSSAVAKVTSLQETKPLSPKTTEVAKPARPWQTAVRIKVRDGSTLGFGSGTVIGSDSEESTILSCAHIFKIRSPPRTPSEFKNPISVDLFADLGAEIRLPAQLEYVGQTFTGEVIDYDFTRDVSLIRIRPGKKLPYSPVVPVGLTPTIGEMMISLGCSHGKDATAIATKVTEVDVGLSDHKGYNGFACDFIPAQGRSGGGLYVSSYAASNHYQVAGVCDFAEPRNRVGLYASPRSIHAILERNNLLSLCAEPDTDLLDKAA